MVRTFYLTQGLLHNNRKIIKIVVSRQSDRAFAVVDINTLWSILQMEKHFIGMDVPVRFIQN